MPRLELDVLESTTTLVVTIFDEIAESMVTKSAAILLQAHEEDDENAIPHEVLQLVNTMHALELKTHTYYDHGIYKSFIVSRLIRTIVYANVLNDDASVANGEENGNNIPTSVNCDKSAEQDDSAVQNLIEGVEDTLSGHATPQTSPKKNTKPDVVPSQKED